VRSCRAVLRLAVAAALCAGALAAVPPARAEEEEEEGAEELREKLTEREDKRRPLEPWSIDVLGRPLTVGGEYELELLALRSALLDEETDDEDLVTMEQGLEVEMFYTFGTVLSLFAQFRVAMEEDLVANGGEPIDAAYWERGEVWIASEDIGGTGLSFDVGHLDFEDDRRWWWDTELDAARLVYEAGDFEVALALGRELFAERTGEGGIDPEQEGVLRAIGEASWDWRFGHSLQGFLLWSDDRSPSERPGDVARRDREDDADARLLWLGARAIGVEDVGAPGVVGYWLDLAWVRGDERRNEYEDLSRRRSVLEERTSVRLSGWAFDAGLAWLLPLRGEPRLYAGYARGSPEFRQSGLEENEAGFGGMERFDHYGVMIDAELANLAVLTIGAGCSLLRSSSLDLVYHHYRLVERRDSFRNARFDVALDGRHRDVGDEIDLVLALEEWERLEFEVIASVFRAGDAFGRLRGGWSPGGFFAVRYGF
jgi:hypothetical protein